MDIAELSLEAFLNETTFPEVDAERDAFVGDFSQFAAIYEPHVGKIIRQLDDRYALVRLGVDKGDVALTCEGRIAGFYHGNTLIIDEMHQGNGLSTPLILEAFKERPAQHPQMLSDAGRAALARAWRVAKGLEACEWL